MVQGFCTNHAVIIQNTKYYLLATGGGWVSVKFQNLSPFWQQKYL